MSGAKTHHERPAEETPWWCAAFVEIEALETAARAAMSVDSPWLVPVHSAAPRVVYGASLEGARPAGPIPVADAVTCALQVCDVLARLHATGWVGLGCDLHDVRVSAEGEGWRASVVVPHLPPRGRFSYAYASWPSRYDAVGRDLCAVVGLLRDLVTGHVPEPLTMWGSIYEYTRPPLPPLGDDGVREDLAAFVGGKRPEDFPDAASLAAHLAPLSRDPDFWRDRAAAMPRARPSTLRRDWDRLVALGEEELARRRGDPYVRLPFAAALHQRGCAAFARGDLDAATRDVERSLDLDPWCRYRVTRGAIREARGDLRGALADFEEAVDSLRLHGPWRDEDDDLMGWPFNRWLDGRDAVLEAARALYARGVTRWRLGDGDGALADLNDASGLGDAMAWELANESGAPVTGSWSEVNQRTRRALRTVLRSRVRAGDAASRPRLVDLLHTDGEVAEARAEARAALAASPDDARLRKRYRRMFGEDFERP